MIIGIISRANLENRLFWSGTENSVYNNLKLKDKIKIIKIDNLNNSLRKIFAIKREYLRIIKKIKYDETYNDTISKNFSRQIENRIKDINLDYLLTFDTSLVAYLKTNIPIILWTDILYSDYYEHYYGKKYFSRNP